MKKHIESKLKLKILMKLNQPKIKNWSNCQAQIYQPQFDQNPVLGERPYRPRFQHHLSQVL